MPKLYSMIGGGSGGGADTRAGSAVVSNGAQTTTVLFSSSFASTSYSLVTSITNTVDVNPIWLNIVSTTKTTTGFTVTYNAPADSANYLLEYVAAANT